MQAGVRPPWVLLDFEADQRAVGDLQESFKGAEPPLPLVPGPNFVTRAEADFHSLYARSPEPDLQPGAVMALPRDLDAPVATAAPPAPADAVAAALPPLPPASRYEAYYIPPETTLGQMTGQQVRWNVTEPGGAARTVFMLRAPVSHNGALLHQPYIVQAAPAAAARRAAGAIVGEGDDAARQARNKALFASLKGADPFKLLVDTSDGAKPRFVTRTLEEAGVDDTLEMDIQLRGETVATLRGAELRRLVLRRKGAARNAMIC